MTEANDRGSLAAIAFLSGMIAPFATGTIAFAQAGSTGGSIDNSVGGTIGETDKPVAAATAWGLLT